ncbi:MAG: glycosyltransferase family 4 protein [Gemmataceae bacterium]
MNLIGLVSSQDHVCCRYRLAAFQAGFAQAGHRVDLVSLPRSLAQRWRLFRQLRGASVILQRHLLPSWQLSLLRKSVQHLLFDFDDAVFLRDSYSSKGLYHSRRLNRFVGMVRASDFVVAGNEFLAEQARLYTPDNRVEVIPTCVDPSKYAPRQEAGSGTQLVWIGSSSTLQGLERNAALFNALGRAIPGVRLKVICDRFPTFPQLPVERVVWSEATESEALAQGDIGVTWIPDDDWSRGKCGLKLLQYMAAGLPVIANPVGVHATMVRPGSTGLLATSIADWVVAVQQLSTQPAVRMAMGQAGLTSLQERYSVRFGLDRWLELLERLEKRRLISVR